MANKVEWGIRHVKFAPLVDGGAFPDFEASDVVLSSLIVINSFNHAEEDNTQSDIEWEDVDTKLKLPGSVGNKSITLESNNVSEEAYKFFKGYLDGTDADAGYLVNDPNHNDSQTLAMQYVTRPISGYKALQHEFTPVLVTVKKTGNTGKNGLPAFQVKCDFQPNFDADGNEVRNHRWKELDEPVTT